MVFKWIIFAGLVVLFGIGGYTLIEVIYQTEGISLKGITLCAYVVVMVALSLWVVKKQLELYAGYKE